MVNQEAASHAPGWEVIASSIGIVVLLVVFVLVMAWLVRPDGSDGSDGGGGPPGPPNKPPPGPSWWPEFERDFAAYVARKRAPASLMHRR